MDAIVEVEHVSKRYRRIRGDRPSTLKESLLRGRRRRQSTEEFWALRDVSLRISPGQMVGLIGRNGAGKSTLLRLIGGVGRPTSGTLRTHGRVGALLDLGAGFHPDLTGRENVIISGVINGLTRREVAERFEDIVDFAELEAFIDSPLRTYSTGMTLRLAFAITVHSEPSILLIDEVLAVGDVAFQRKCLDRIAAFQARGCAIVLVTHDASAIQTLCDEAVWLRDGLVAAHGPAATVVDQYLLEMQRETRQRIPLNPPASAPAHGSLRLGENRFGSLEVELGAVTLRDGVGAVTNEIRSGDPLRVAFTYEARLPVATPRFGASITRADGVVCLDLSMPDSSLEDMVTGAGQVVLEIDRLDLAAGSYYVNVGVYEHDWAYAYDYHWQVYAITVDEPSAGRGIMASPHRWRYVQ